MFSLCHFCGQIKGDIMDWVLINPSQTVFCCNDCINKTYLTINPSPVIPPTNPSFQSDITCDVDSEKQWTYCPW